MHDAANVAPMLTATNPMTHASIETRVLRFRVGVVTGIRLARERNEMLTTLQARMRRTHAVSLVALVATLALAGCRGDDATPDVFTDPGHCVRETDAAPFGMCDVIDTGDAADQ